MNKLSCDNYREMISAELDGELGNDDRAKLGLHLVQCAECRKFAEQISLFHEIIDSEKALRLPKARRRLILRETIGSNSIWDRILYIIGISGKLTPRAALVASLAIAVVTLGIYLTFTSQSHEQADMRAIQLENKNTVLKLVLSDNDIVATSTKIGLVLSERDIIKTKTVVLSTNGI